MDFVADRMIDLFRGRRNEEISCEKQLEEWNVLKADINATVALRNWCREEKHNLAALVRECVGKTRRET